MGSVDEYLAHGFDRVRGWLELPSARVIATMGRWHLEEGIRGAVGEIGVHHGKLAILLQLLARDDEQCFAIDVFDLTEFNVDGSGAGDLALFRRNVQRWGDIQRFHIIRASSEEVTPVQLVGAVGKVRLMSIDGGHTSQLTVNDLELAEQIMAEDGVVFLDDAFNFGWPGVMSGLVRFLATPRTLVPVALSPNKTFLVRPEASDRYRAFSAQPNFRGCELARSNCSVTLPCCWIHTRLRRAGVAELRKAECTKR